jgi:hypothetical protein
MARPTIGDSGATNTSLQAARRNRNDEFYTQLTDIEKELRYYKDHFKGKTIFCNCDDPEWSNFWKYFSLNFEHLELKKVITTHFAQGATSYKLEYFGEAIGVVKTDLLGDGDFRSDECVEILKEADIVVTNPPFSLFREYLSKLVEHGKKFVVIGNNNAITYKETFKLIKNNQIWLGISSPKQFKQPDGTLKAFGNIGWFTNIPHKKRNEELTLYKTYTGNEHEYPKYDNYDAIEVSKVANIPVDYAGAMGVPITFLDKFNPEQFEIVGITKTWFGAADKAYPPQIQVSVNGHRTNVTKLNDGATLKLGAPPKNDTYYIVADTYYVQLYARVLIRRKQSVPNKKGATSEN